MYLRICMETKIHELRFTGRSALYKTCEFYLSDQGRQPQFGQNSTCSFIVVYLAAWPMAASEAGGDLALIQTSLLLSCKCKLVSIRTTWSTQQKQWGLYQNKVTCNVAAIQRPGHWTEICKMVCSGSWQSKNKELENNKLFIYMKESYFWSRSRVDRF